MSVNQFPLPESIRIRLPAALSRSLIVWGGYINFKYSILKKLLTTLFLWSSQIVNALYYLKEKHGVIHRDVKPSNILLDASGRIKLCDFGISGRLVDSKAKTRSAGCAAYMAVSRLGDFGKKMGEPWDLVLLLGMGLVLTLLVFFSLRESILQIPLSQTMISEQMCGVLGSHWWAISTVLYYPAIYDDFTPTSTYCILCLLFIMPNVS